MPRKAPSPTAVQAAPIAAHPAAAARPAIWRLAPLWVAAGLVAGVLIDYGQLCGKHGIWFLADDDDYVTMNKNVYNGLTRDNVIWAFTKSHSANWHPLTWLSLQLDCEINGTFEPN